MFAVNGWNVSSANIVQQGGKATSGAERGDNIRKSKKRKRIDQDADKSRKIQANDLGKLWDQRFGGAESRRTSAQIKDNGHKKESKKPHTDNIEPAHVSPKKKSSQNAPPASKGAGALISTQSKDAKGHRGSDDGRLKDQSKNAKDHRRSHDGRSKDQPKDASRGSRDAVKAIQSNPSTAEPDTIAKSITKTLPPPPPPATNLTPLQAKMRSKLTSARFRHLNETLYTTDSSTALSLFASSPDLFTEYHNGFSQQVASSWPRNPVDDFISAIKTRGPLNNTNPTINPLPRRKTQSCTIADLGCGDAPLVRALIPSSTKKLHLTIHSYDLHAPNQHVTVADIAHLPLRDGEADIAIFCLSIMGTNWIDFVEEAWRVLRGDGKGEVWVAEVKSRFGRPSSSAAKGGNNRTHHRPGEAVAHSVGKRQKPQTPGKKRKGGAGADADDDEADLPADLFTSTGGDGVQGQDEENTPDLRSFIDVFTKRGFQLKPNSVDARNKMFVSMTFFKSGIPTAGKHKGMKWTGKQYERVGKRVDDSDDEAERLEEGKVLKPCVYKSR